MRTRFETKPGKSFASAGVFHHAGIKIPYFAFFGHDSGLRVPEAPRNMLLAMAIVAVKPFVFASLLQWQGETRDTAWEAGYRLGQASEFSLLLSYVAAGTTLLGNEAAHVIQGATVLTMILSTYAVVFRYPSPIAVSSRLRRD